MLDNSYFQEIEVEEFEKIDPQELEELKDTINEEEEIMSLYEYI